MGRRKSNISQPMVLDIMLAPFTEMFYLDPSDTTQQWYYANTNEYLPNHAGDSPLIITPQLQVQDPDTNIVYTPTFYQVSWLYRDPTNGTYNDRGEYVGSGGAYVKITNTTDGAASSYPYVVYPDGHIKVKRNIPFNDPLTLLCVVEYNDPRAAGTTFKVRDTIDLVTNRDATQIMPTIDIDCESTQKFDIFKDATSQFAFTAKVMQGVDDITNSVASYIRWYAFDNVTTSETLIDTTSTVDGISVKTFPCYVSGQGTKTLTIDAMYAEKITIVARLINSATSELYPTKSYRSLVWDDVPLEGIVHSENSGAVRDNTTAMSFDTIVNVHGATLTDAQKTNHLRFKWFLRNAQSAAQELIYWCQNITLAAAKLRQYATTLVYNEVHIKGANEYITCNGEIVTSAPSGGTREAVTCRT